ncbi:dihydrofolate reductase-like protein [Morchella snyderi]|nr:dihydrofolate reductase-like protein [Morchella snyderi]
MTPHPATTTTTMPPTPLTVVVAATTTLGIGKSGGLPWRLRKELSYFARVTKRLVPEAQKKKNAVIMGRKTWDSIPAKFRPLPDRINVVVSRTTNNSVGEDAVVWARSLDDALEALKSGGSGEVGRIFVIGGAQLYDIAMKYPGTTSILMTSIDKEFDVDTFFPVDIRDPANGWKKRTHGELSTFVNENVPESMQEDGVPYGFELYEKDQ